MNIKTNIKSSMDNFFKLDKLKMNNYNNNNNKFETVDFF